MDEDIFDLTHAVAALPGTGIADCTAILIRKDVANRWALQPDRRNQPLYDRRVAGLDSFRRCVLAPIKVFQFCTVVPCRVVFDRLDLKRPARAEHRSLEDQQEGISPLVSLDNKAGLERRRRKRIGTERDSRGVGIFFGNAA